MLVRLLRAVRSAFHLNTVNGRVQILHSAKELAKFSCPGMKLSSKSKDSAGIKRYREIHTFSVVLFDHLNVWILW
jgi:hypothetical protein